MYYTTILQKITNIVFFNTLEPIKKEAKINLASYIKKISVFLETIDIDSNFLFVPITLHTLYCVSYLNFVKLKNKR